MISKIAIPFILLLLTEVTFAQFKMPTFDIELKAHQILMPGEGRNDGELKYFETTNYYGAVHLQLGQRVGIGVFYGKSVRGTEGVSYNDGSSDQVWEAITATQGVDLRLSAGRARRWRPYLSLVVGRIEAVESNDSYRLAAKSAMYGFNLGLMRRLGNRLYFNVIELGAKYVNDRMFWFDDYGPGSQMLVDAKMGLTYNIGRKK
jgi:hypothetical protein